MALRDVKQYYIKMLNQYIEVKDDLVDFEKGLQDGYITEDQLQDAKDDLANIKNNLDRLTYILFLFEEPKTKKKKTKYKKANQSIYEYFKEVSADQNAVIDENISLIKHLRDELNKLKK